MTNSKYGVYICAAGDLLFYDRMIRRRHLRLFAAVTLSALSSHDITDVMPPVLMDRKEKGERGKGGAGCGIMKTSLYGRRS